MRSSTHLDHLDGWRGVAVSLVLLMHFYTRTEMDFGAFGVDMFFVLSGRLIADMLFIREMPPSLFLKRRVSRIIPALVVFVVGAIAIQAACIAVGIQLTNYIGWTDLIFASSFTVNYAFDFGVSQSFHHLWSLAVEEHCYLLVALIAITFAHKARDAARLAIMLGVMFYLNGQLQDLLGGEGYSVYWRSDVRGAGLLVSFGLYLLVRDHWRNAVPSYAGFIAPVAFAAAVVLALYPLPEGMRWGIAPLALAVSMATFDCAVDWWKRAFALRPLIWIGMVSYSVYLWQQPFYANKPWLGSETGLVLGVSLGLCSFFFVERPARRYLNATWARERAPAVAAEHAA